MFDDALVGAVSTETEDSEEDRAAALHRRMAGLMPEGRATVMELSPEASEWSLFKEFLEPERGPLGRCGAASQPPFFRPPPLPCHPLPPPLLPSPLLPSPP